MIEDITRGHLNRMGPPKDKFEVDEKKIEDLNKYGRATVNQEIHQGWNYEGQIVLVVTKGQDEKKGIKAEIFQLEPTNFYHDTDRKESEVYKVTLRKVE